jgi:hypothetical protein
MKERMDEVVHESARDVPVVGSYDVVVCGGGPAGCAAAIAAARHGASTLLVEREGYLGGSPATQFVTVILTTNGVDCQGIWHELMHELRRRHGVTGLIRHPKPMCDYILTGSVDPEAIRHAWDTLLSDAGVHLIHFCSVCGTLVERGLASGIFIESVAGRQAIRGRRIVDCTGDGGVCAAAGVPWQQGVNDEVYGQACNFLGYLGGLEGQPSDTAVGVRALPHNRTLVTGDFHYEVNPLDPRDLTRAVREGRRRLWDHAVRVAASDPAKGGGYLQATASHLGVRVSRRIRGIAEVTERDVWEFRKYEDGIAKGSWDIDIYDPHRYPGFSVPRHTPEYQARIERMRQRDYYDIRYGAIVAAKIDNLLVAGRCLSADHVAQSSLRIQQTCMSTGQAAGVAAALSLKANVCPRELDPSVVVKQLTQDRHVEPAFQEL